MSMNPIGGETYRRLDAVLTPMVDRLSVSVLASAANEVAPRFVAEGRDVVSVGSGKRRSPQQARDYLRFVAEDALSVREDIVAEVDIVMLGDLIRAIRDAERGEPTPPAAIARAA